MYTPLTPGQVFLPKLSQCPLRFMKEILNLDKNVSPLTQYIKFNVANLQPVPTHNDLLMKNVYRKAVEKHPRLKDYFPDYFPEYLPPRGFFWPIYKTLHPGDAQKLINDSMMKKLG